MSSRQTPGIAISDWDGTGYKTPIVLAVVEATVTSNFLTIVDVTPSEGDLEVASDLTFGRVERRGSGVIRLFRATGSTARADDYFDTSGSPTYPDADLVLQTVDDGAAKYDVSGSGNNANFTLDTGENADVADNIITGDFFLLAIAEPQVSRQIQGDGQTGIPSGAAEVRTTTPTESRIRGSAESGVPAGSARIRGTTSPDITIADWDDTGYKTPVVLAVVRATIRAATDRRVFGFAPHNVGFNQGPFASLARDIYASLTVVDVTPNEGELQVGSDLTFGRIERRADGVVRLYPTTGSTANADDYFGTSGPLVYPAADFTIQTTRDGKAKYDLTESGLNANFTLRTGENSDVVDNIATGDLFLAAIAQLDNPIQIQGDGATGVPTGTTRIRTTVPTPLRIRGTVESGVPTSSARVYNLPPVRVAGSVESGVPTGSASIYTLASRISGTVESGVPTGTTRVRTTVPGALRLRGTAESGVPTGTTRIRTTVPTPLRVRGTAESGVPTGTTRVRTTVPGAIRLIATAQTGVPAGLAAVTVMLPPPLVIQGAVESGVPTGTARIRRRLARRRLRGDTQSGVPAGTAQIRTTVPSPLRLRGTGESGIPTGLALVHNATPVRVRGTRESGVPTGRARILAIVPGALRVIGSARVRSAYRYY